MTTSINPSLERVSLILAFASALAACEGPKATPEVVPLLSTPAPSPAALGRPAAPTPTQTLHSSTSEKTTVAADGTVRTTRTSSSVTFNPGQASAAAAGLLSAATRPSDGSIPGSWRSTSSNGATCEVTLYGDPTAVSGSASASCSNPTQLLVGSTAWSYADGKLTLLKGSEVAMVFHRADAHHFAGTAKWGFLTTTIRLTR